MTTMQQRSVDHLYDKAAGSFDDWDLVREVIDEAIDLALNYRQSGHPGGSRSKVHLFLSLLLSGAMRWDIRRPWRPFADRFVLSAGHTVPLVYVTLAILNETLRARAERDPDPAFAFPDDGRWALTWEDLLMLRRRGGLAGHAEMEGKTLFLKFNTGPSGHGMPPAAGEAVALKLAGAEEVKVFVVEGEGGLTPGASHETRNTAWGLGLNNLVFLVDWNDYGIDDTPIHEVVPGTPESWFGAYDWRVTGTMEGSEWAPVTRAVLEAARGENPERRPSVAWFKTRKGRGYGKYDNKSHGSPHAMNSPEFWAVRKAFMERHGVSYEGVDQPAPTDAAEREAQARRNFEVAIGVLRRNTAVVDAISDRLIEVANSVPDRVEGFNLDDREAKIFDDPRITDVTAYPAEMWKQPGEKAPNRAALAAWGSWINAFAKAEYGRPLVIACSADLADSTNIAGFAKDFGEMPGWGWYQRDTNPRGALLPQQITEFTNAGLMVGLATVNLASDPMKSFNGFWGACSTYGSFSYLKYGPMRLFSQLAQDCELKLGKVIWVAGHSGPETAEDSRTHFGIFATGVTQLFPEGHVIDLHPWEYNEVPVVLAAALATDVPIVALHLTRPTVEIPDRAALGMASHFDAARGAYLIRDARPGSPSAGTVYVQGTVTTANVVKILPELDRAGINVRVVAAISPQLFRRQDATYRDLICSASDRWDGMAITNRAFKLMTDFVDGPVAKEYSLSSDWDDRWRTGGTVDEVMDEAHLGPGHILAAIERYAADREARHARLRAILDAVERPG
ncbi:MAG TPA: 1-deoxy-D-xylulose-5-phosphate synthase N-terminal domain-containing protein [Candidatus Limnocylindria bacterium]